MNDLYYLWRVLYKDAIDETSLENSSLDILHQCQRRASFICPVTQVLRSQILALPSEKGQHDRQATELVEVDSSSIEETITWSIARAGTLKRTGEPIYQDRSPNFSQFA
ncbi:hypothetical protein CEP53_008139 [Fusarium sp. AF-6]|nr:hypothetical protein CEP53_008139 [Fusarium sp. AF-6]